MHIFHWQGCMHVFCHFWWLAIPTWFPEAQYNLDITLGCVWSLWEFTWCHFNLCGYLWLIAPSMNYLCIPHNIVYLFVVLPRSWSMFFGKKYWITMSLKLLKLWEYYGDRTHQQPGGHILAWKNWTTISHAMDQSQVWSQKTTICSKCIWKCIHNVIICIQTCFESKSFTVFSISEQICDGCKDNSKIQDFVSLTNPYCLLDFQIWQVIIF